MDVLLLDQAAVERLIDARELLDVLEDGFRALSAGDVVASMPLVGFSRIHLFRFCGQGHMPDEQVVGPWE